MSGRGLSWECGDPYSGIGCPEPNCNHRPEGWPENATMYAEGRSTSSNEEPRPDTTAMDGLIAFGRITGYNARREAAGRGTSPELCATCFVNPLPPNDPTVFACESCRSEADDCPEAMTHRPATVTAEDGLSWRECLYCGKQLTTPARRNS